MSQTFTREEIIGALDALQTLSFNLNGFHSILCMVRDAENYPTDAGLDVLCDTLGRFSEALDTAVDTIDDAIRKPAVLAVAIGQH